LGRLVARRARFVIIQLAGAATAAFFLIRMVPGDPARVIAGPAASEQVLAAIRRHLGLDQSLPVQYWRYLTNLVRGDLGNSITTGQPVFDDLIQRVPATLELISLAMLVSLLLGVPLGFAMARRRLRGKGKVIFIREGCWWCHTLLPEQTQDWAYFGEPPLAGDVQGESPSLFGSDRKAPDLLHIASRNRVKAWHYVHHRNPRAVTPGSIMPAFEHLTDEELDAIIAFLESLR